MHTKHPSHICKVDHIGNAKQTFEMVGTALFIIPLTRYFGLVLMMAAVPLAYESVRRKVNTRVLYVDGTTESLDHSVLKFWKQAKGMGSKLVVGISSDIGPIDDRERSCIREC